MVRQLFKKPATWLLLFLLALTGAFVYSAIQSRPKPLLYHGKPIAEWYKERKNETHPDGPAFLIFFNVFKVQEKANAFKSRDAFLPNLMWGIRRQLFNWRLLSDPGQNP